MKLWWTIKNSFISKVSDKVIAGKIVYNFLLVFHHNCVHIMLFVRGLGILFKNSNKNSYPTCILCFAVASCCVNKKILILLLQCTAKWWQCNIPRLYSSSHEPHSSNQYVHISRASDTAWRHRMPWWCADDVLLSAKRHNQGHTYFQVR